MENGVTWNHDGSRRLVTVGDVVQWLQDLKRRLEDRNLANAESIIDLCLEELHSIPGMRTSVEKKPKSTPTSDDAMEKISKIVGTQQACELAQILLDIDYDGIKIERVSGSDFGRVFSLKYWRKQ